MTYVQLDLFVRWLRRIWYRFFECGHPFARPLYSYERRCPDCGQTIRGLGGAQSKPR